jgi:hypothetical protein
LPPQLPSSVQSLLPVKAKKKTATQSVSLVVASITLELYYGSSSQLAFLCKECKEMDRRTQKGSSIGKIWTYYCSLCSNS